MQIDSEQWEPANGTYPSVGNKEFYRISESIFKRRILTANKYLSGISKSLARRPAFTMSASSRGYAFMVHTTEGSSRFHGFFERYKSPFPLLYSIDGSSDSNLPFVGGVKVPAGRAREPRWRPELQFDYINTMLSRFGPRRQSIAHKTKDCVVFQKI